MSAGPIKLVGIAGFVDGEEFTISEGESIVIGRSRSCDISLRNCEKYLEVDPGQTHVEEHFRTVSRKHVTITYTAIDKIKVTDSSSNGTFVDGSRIAGAIVIRDLASAPHEIKLGTNEAFRIQPEKKLVPRKRSQVIEVDEGQEPPEGAVLIEGGDDEPETGDDLDIVEADLAEANAEAAGIAEPLKLEPDDEVAEVAELTLDEPDDEDELPEPKKEPEPAKGKGKRKGKTKITGKVKTGRVKTGKVATGKVGGAGKGKPPLRRSSRASAAAARAKKGKKGKD